MKVLKGIIVLVACVGCVTAPTKKAKKESIVFVKGSSSTAKNKVSLWAKCKKPKKANQSNFKDWVENTNVCVKKGDWKKVKFLSTSMLSQFPDSPWGVYFESLLAERSGNIIRANWMVDRALSMTPEVGLFHFQKARLLLGEGERGLARAQFKRALDLDQSLSEAAVFLAKASFKDEDYKTVISYSASVANDNETEDLLVILMESYRALKKYDQSLVAAKKLSRRYTKNFHYGLRVAQLLEEFPEKRKEALQAYEKLLNSARKVDNSRKLITLLPDKISSLKRMIASAKKKEKQENQEKK